MASGSPAPSGRHVASSARRTRTGRPADAGGCPAPAAAPSAFASTTTPSVLLSVPPPLSAAWRDAGSCFSPDSSSAMPPHAFGDDIDVPFISMRFWSVHVGTGAMAPPGAENATPGAPSAVGPRELHVYCRPAPSEVRTEWPASARRGDTYAPMPNRPADVPPGRACVDGLE
eukprot:360050-Chlamydomonas_euryale.AAC.1